MAVVRVVEVGQVPRKYIDILLQKLNERAEKHKFIFNDTMELPDDAYDSYRQQYDAAKLLEHARTQKTLLVTNADLYSEARNFVFGLTKNSGPAVVSIARLDPTFYGQQMNFSLTADRLVKEAIHETGHMFGLPHCDDRQCAMAFSQHFSDVDTKGHDFCNNCELKMTTEGTVI